MSPLNKTFHLPKLTQERQSSALLTNCVVQGQLCYHSITSGWVSPWSVESPCSLRPWVLQSRVSRHATAISGGHLGQCLWKTGVVIVILKKRNWGVCSNYTRITLLSLPRKLYARVLERTVHLLAKLWIREDQCGPDHGTLDQVFI